MAMEQQQQQQQLLCDDVFYGAMRWMDGETLAIAGCVSSSFHRESRNEQLWEDLCARMWPSVREPGARLLVQHLGGFRNLYSQCSRLVSPEVCDSPPPAPTKAASFSDFASLVDVQFRGKSLFSKFVDGIPGTGTELTSEWFSSCPFRVDLIQESLRCPQHELQMEDEAASASCSSEVGRLWKEICDEMKLSWILIDKVTKQAINLSSWRPVFGQRHWPTDMDFVLRYGCILSQSLPGPVECSINLKCRLLRSWNRQGCSSIQVKLTELTMQLKDGGSGDNLNGRDGLPVLCQAAGFAKCRDEELVLRAHKECLKRQNDFKVHELKHEWCLDVYVLLLVLVGLVLLLCTV